MKLTKELKELLDARDLEYRERHPLTSDERHKEILEASNSVTLDDYDPNGQWSFKDGESPFEWYDAQVKAINHFGHIFCINPFYDNFNKYTWDGRLKSNEAPKFYGFEFDSTEELLNYLNQSNVTKEHLDMTIRTIKYLKSNNGIEFPNGWGDQFQE
jgi:hypothetical protein